MSTRNTYLRRPLTDVHTLEGKIRSFIAELNLVDEGGWYGGIGHAAASRTKTEKALFISPPWAKCI